MPTPLHFRLRVTSLPFLLATEKLKPLVQLSEKMGDAEETLKRIEGHKGVIGTIIVNSEGLPIRTTLDNSTTSLYGRLLRNFTTLARSGVRDIDPQNDLTFVRIRSKKQEILVAPENNYLLVVVQNPSE
ncbi:dynein light chain roadblock-type 2-like [Poeciliopsis prolifica]|uniref:dynein light chain roadblock-type 2-like n=1 Tax=Poeciliopsis prolifica TaxID=188132 RepID=UPI002412F544|nr:dynein light chain roadblock-type 2-like [Poeciliopsis prolifica]